MQVNNVQSNNYKPNFGMLKFEKSVIPLLKELSPEELKQVRNLKKEAAKTKHWDLTISSVNDGMFYEKFKNRHNLQEHHVSLDSWKLEKDTVHVHSYTCDENVHDELRFPTIERAKEVYNSMNTEYAKLSPFRQIKKFINALKYLDESYEYMAKNPITKKVEQASVPKEATQVVTKPTVGETVNVNKISFSKRFKNAWQALNGK